MPSALSTDPTIQTAIQSIDEAGGKLGPPSDSPDVDVPNVDLEDYIQGGAQGWVFRGRVRTTGLVVAVKVLKESQVQAGDRAAREALLAARIHHPNVIRVYMVERVGQHWVILMEFVQGSALNESEEIRQRLRVTFAQLANAVRALGLDEIVHRDIKPANIILRSKDSTPVLVDFGLAVSANLFDPERDGATVGTPIYMPPGAFRLERPETSWDVYSLGMTAADVTLRGDLPRPQDLAELRRQKLSGEFDRNVLHQLSDLKDLDERDWIEPLIDPSAERRSMNLRFFAKEGDQGPVPGIGNDL